MATQEIIVNSVSSYLNLLRESDNRIKIIGLEKLCKLVDYHWAEIAEHLTIIEQLHEDEKFEKRDQAAYLASKVYFHLEQYEEALNLALESNSYFNLVDSSLYVQSLVSTCVDKYTAMRQQNYEATKKEDTQQINKKYEDVVNYLFDQSFKQNNYKQIIGIAIESRRLDKIEEILVADNQNNQNSNSELLNYIYDISMSIVNNLKFRGELLRLIVKFYNQKKLQHSDYINLSQCYYFLNDYESIATVLYNLLKSNQQEQILLSYQIANDISENENLYFINQVIQAFPIEQDPNLQQLRQNLIKVLNGEIREQSNQLFLKNNYKSDSQVLQKIKGYNNDKKQVPHQGTLMANAIFNAGTCNLDFLKDPKNKEYFDKAANWGKFTSIASLGVIYKGFYQSDVFKEHLPKGDLPNPNYYQNGGALYGIGLQFIGTKNQEKNNEIISIIKNGTFNTQEAIIHGSCLALGLINLGSKDEALCQQLKDIMEQNQAVTGEAAALAIGLVMAGSGDENTIQSLVNFGQQTDHEKIIRAIGLSLSLTVFNKKELADTLIEQLVSDKDAILRQGGCMTMGMAYAGSGSSKIVQKLLNVIVHEVSDDTKRLAVIGIGFVMFRQPEALIKIIKQLILSFNPHIRYGTAMAIGIACAGTMYKEALDILEPMLEDTVDFVRQAAYLGLAMVIQQANKTMEPRLEKFQKKIDDILSKKHEDVLVKLGCCLAYSILEAGGRNQVIRLASNAGVARLGSCVSMQVFIHFWYWYPLVHFFSLTLQPAGIIGLNQNFKIPQSFEFQCNAKPSLFEYIPAAKQEEKKEQVKQQTVNLSTTQKAKLKKEKKNKSGTENELQLSKLNSQNSQMSSLIQQSMSLKKDESMIKKPEDKEKMEIEEKKEEAPQEPSSFTLKNPARVLDKQKKFIQYIENRYQPIIKERKNGLVFLTDSKPEEADQYLSDEKLKQKMDLEPISEKNEINQQQGQDKGKSEDEIQPPEDFIYNPNSN